MQLLTNITAKALWFDVIKDAECTCSVRLQAEIEAYLITLLMRYTNKPELLKQVLAIAFLDALERREMERKLGLQTVGDNCLLFAGLFPRIATKKHVKLSYFVGLGQSSYAAISRESNDIYNSLAVQFVELMDVLQSIRKSSHLEPLEAYEQWDELGSRRALKILQSYVNNPLIFKNSI